MATVLSEYSCLGDVPGDVEYWGRYLVLSDCRQHPVGGWLSFFPPPPALLSVITHSCARARPSGVVFPSIPLSAGI